VDWIKFLNDVTGGHLLAWKVVATSVIFALAGMQVVLAARFWAVTAFPGVSPQVAVKVQLSSPASTPSSNSPGPPSGCCPSPASPFF
jgi:hypothetical protein